MKKITLVIAMFAMAMASSAQYTGHKFFDNWSIGAEGGVSTNLHDWDVPNGAVAGINFTKGITLTGTGAFAARMLLTMLASMLTPRSTS